MSSSKNVVGQIVSLIQKYDRGNRNFNLWIRVEEIAFLTPAKNRLKLRERE